MIKWWGQNLFFWVLLTAHKSPGFNTEDFWYFKQLSLSEVCLLLLWLSLKTSIELSCYVDSLLQAAQQIGNIDVTTWPKNSSFIVNMKSACRLKITSFCGCDWLMNFNQNETRVSAYQEFVIWWSSGEVEICSFVEFCLRHIKVQVLELKTFRTLSN